MARKYCCNNKVEVLCSTLAYWAIGKAHVIKMLSESLDYQRHSTYVGIFPVIKVNSLLTHLVQNH